MPEARPRTLLLIPSYAKRGVEAAVADNLHPTMDYYALQARLDADLADYGSADADPHPLVKAARLVRPRRRAGDARLPEGRPVRLHLLER